MGGAVAPKPTRTAGAKQDPWSAQLSTDRSTTNDGDITPGAWRPQR